MTDSLLEALQNLEPLDLSFEPLDLSGFELALDTERIDTELLLAMRVQLCAHCPHQKTPDSCKPGSPPSVGKHGGNHGGNLTKKQR
jgi:hypothetical protein